jgi:multiple sugar transport system permease protein
MFAGISRTETRDVPQAVLDANGRPVQVSAFVGLANFATVIQPSQIAAAFRDSPTFGALWRTLSDTEFVGALIFTLIYVLLTTLGMLALGLALALAVNNVARRLRGGVIAASLLPLVVTPLVGSLAIYWMFLDNGLATWALRSLGVGQIYFMHSSLPIRALIVAYGIWNSAPFALIVFYAGLQTVPLETMEAARIDGASSWRVLRAVTIPHMMPLIVFVTLIHLMDSYRVFEPILVFSSRVFANSVQFQTYYILNTEDNADKAAAAGLLTVLGVAVLVTPSIRRIWREQRGLT